VSTSATTWAEQLNAEDFQIRASLRLDGFSQEHMLLNARYLAGGGYNQHGLDSIRSCNSCQAARK